MKARDWLSVSECSGLHDISEKTVRRALAKGRLPGRRVGDRGCWRISRAVASAYFELPRRVQTCPTRVFVAVLVSSQSGPMQLPAEDLIERLPAALKPTAERMLAVGAITPTAYGSHGTPLYDAEFFQRCVELEHGEAERVAAGAIRTADHGGFAVLSGGKA